MAGKKRSHEDFADGDAASGQPAHGKTVAQSPHASPRAASQDASDAKGSPKGEWQTVESRATKKLKKVPRHESSNYPAITHAASARLNSHVKIGDLQQLALYILADGSAPQWVQVRHRIQIRKVVVVMVPGLEAGMFDGSIPLEPVAADDDVDVDVAMKGADAKNRTKTLSPDDYYPVKLVAEDVPAPLRPFAEAFPHLWPIKTPGDDKYHKIHSPLQAILISQLPKSKEEKKQKGPRAPKTGKDWQNTRTPVTEYLASAADLLENGYTLHPVYASSDEEREDLLRKREEDSGSAGHSWVDTAVEKLEDGAAADGDVEQGSVTRGRDLIIMDCEMVKTEEGFENLDLARISMVNWDGTVILDELVKPSRPVIDYLTPFSGITPEMLAPVTTTLADIQKRLLDLITPRTILIGHSLDSDLRALKLTHPFIVDTSILYPHPRGPPLKSSLKYLTQKYLSREIQNRGAGGHDSVEDARACLDLVKQKCEKGPLWGTSDMSGESIFKRLQRSVKPRGQTTGAADEMRTGAVVDWGDPRKGHGSHADVTVGCESDADVVEGVKKVVNGRVEMKGLPVEGVDFCWARLRELEAVRGWWTRGRSADTAALRANALAKANAASTTTATTEEVAGDAVQDPAPVPTPTAAVDTPPTHPTSRPPPSPPSPATLAAAVAQTANHIRAIHASLPPTTALIVYSGTGDPRETQRLHAQKATFNREYRVKKWDELSVKWTDDEEQALKRACREARRGVGFLGVK